MSSFEWIGNHYRLIDQPAGADTEAHWKALRRWVSKQAKRGPRSGDLDGPHPEIFAFPAALEAMRAGATRAANP